MNVFSFQVSRCSCQLFICLLLGRISILLVHSVGPASDFVHVCLPNVNTVLVDLRAARVENSLERKNR